MKIMHLLATNSFSGAENVVCQIIDMYKNDKNLDMVYCSPNGKIKNKLVEKNIKFYPLNKLNYSSIKKAIMDFEPDIIHAHDIKATIYASLFSKKCKIISHVHGNSIDMRKTSLKSLLFLIVSKKVEHIFWVSDSSLSQYKFYKQICNKSSVLVNVVDKKEIIYNSKKFNIDEKYDAVFVGRLVKLKNPKRLLNIFLSVVGKVPTAKLAIVGNGPMYDELKEYINNNNLNNNVFLLGFQTNPYVYIKNSKIMLLTSIYEGTPMCALEALCLGKPIVSTPTDGMKDLIKQGFNGFLSDKDDELINNIIKLSTNDKKLLQMSKNADNDSTKNNDIVKYKKVLNQYYK